MSFHRCAVTGCTRRVPTSLLMCKQHWFLVPPAIRERVWAAYQKGQESGAPMPSREYADAVRAAREAVAVKLQYAAQKRTEGVRSLFDE